MVRDGSDDAPAVAAADVGTAARSRTAVAMETAKITLVSGDVGGVADAVALSRATRQNLGWAFGYNLVQVPLDMVHVIPPVLAAAVNIEAKAVSIDNDAGETDPARLRRLLADGSYPPEPA